VAEFRLKPQDVQRDALADTFVRAARTFRLQPSSGQDMSKCRLNAQGVVYRTVFIVG
jgi:hypothetical protein